MLQKLCFRRSESGEMFSLLLSQAPSPEKHFLPKFCAVWDPMFRKAEHLIAL